MAGMDQDDRRIGFVRPNGEHALIVELLRNLDKMPDAKGQVQRFMLEQMLKLPAREPDRP